MFLLSEWTLPDANLCEGMAPNHPHPVLITIPIVENGPVMIAIRLRSPSWEFCKTGKPPPYSSSMGTKTGRPGVSKVNLSVCNRYRYGGLEMPLQKVRCRLWEGDPVIWVYLNLACPKNDRLTVQYMKT
jgi:hypothetical protein